MMESLREKRFVVAHRGASAYEPENTLRAVRRALEMGADAVEVDVRLSRDGHPVVIHDETVDRTTNGRGRVSDMALGELRALDAGKGEKIPLLREVLDLVDGKAILFLELKVREAADVALREVREKGMVDSALFISFDPEAVARVKNLYEKADIGLIYVRPRDGIVLAKKLGAAAVLPFYRLATPKAVAFAKRMGLTVVAWTVDDVKTAEKLWSYGVDGIATNRPDVMIDLRERLRDQQGPHP